MEPCFYHLPHHTIIMDPDPATALIAEQFRRTIDLLRSENAALQRELEHTRQMYDHRISELESCTKDHETRLRTVQDSATQFKVLAGLATGGGLLSIIVLIRTLSALP